MSQHKFRILRNLIRFKAMSKLVAMAKGFKFLDFFDFNSSETLSDFRARIALGFQPGYGILWEYVY